MPRAGNKIRIAIWPMPSRGPKEGRNARLPVHYEGVPKRPARGTKSEVGSSHLPSRGPKRGQKCYITPAFSGVPKAKSGEQNQKWLPHPYLLGGPKEGRNAASPLHSRGPTTPSAGNKIRNGYLSPTFSGAQMRVEVLHHPCILGGPQCQERGTKLEVAFWAVPSRGPKRGQKCSVTCAL